MKLRTLIVVAATIAVSHLTVLSAWSAVVEERDRHDRGVVRLESGLHRVQRWVHPLARDGVSHDGADERE